MPFISAWWYAGSGQARRSKQGISQIQISLLCFLHADVHNYNPSHPSFPLLAGEEGKRSSSDNVKMRITLWLVLSSFGCLRREPSVTAAARHGSSKVPGNRTDLSISTFLSYFSPDELFLQRSDLSLAVEGCITNGNSFTFK